MTQPLSGLCALPQHQAHKLNRLRWLSLLISQYGGGMNTTLSVNRSGREVVLTILQDGVFLSSFTYTEATARITATPVTQPIIVDYAQSYIVVKDLLTFTNSMSDFVKVKKSQLSPHTFDLSYKPNKIDMSLKFSNTTAWDGPYLPDTKEIRIRRDALDLGWNDFIYWLNKVREFHSFVELHQNSVF